MIDVPVFDVCEAVASRLAGNPVTKQLEDSARNRSAESTSTELSLAKVGPLSCMIWMIISQILAKFWLSTCSLEINK